MVKEDNFETKLIRLKSEDSEAYSVLEENFIEVGSALEFLDKPDRRASQIHHLLEHSREKLTIDPEAEAPELDEVRTALQSLEEIGALKEYRSFITRRYRTDEFNEEVFQEVYNALDFVEQMDNYERDFIEADLEPEYEDRRLEEYR